MAKFFIFKVLRLYNVLCLCIHILKLFSPHHVSDPGSVSDCQLCLWEKTAPLFCPVVSLSSRPTFVSLSCKYCVLVSCVTFVSRPNSVSQLSSDIPLDRVAPWGTDPSPQGFLKLNIFLSINCLFFFIVRTIDQYAS